VSVLVRSVSEVMSAAMPALDVYVTQHCFGCTEAMRLARVAARRFPSISIRVVDLQREPDARPENLVAVPTYILDGQIIWLGNPRQVDLLLRLERSLGARPREGER